MKKSKLPALAVLFYSITSQAEPIKGTCEIFANEVKQSAVLYLAEPICGEGPCAMPPVSVSMNNKSGEKRKFRISYSYQESETRFNITIADCDKIYQPPDSTFGVCQSIFSSSVLMPKLNPSEFSIGGPSSQDHELKVICLRTAD